MHETLFSPLTMETGTPNVSFGITNWNAKRFVWLDSFIDGKRDVYHSNIHLRDGKRDVYHSNIHLRDGKRDVYIVKQRI